MPVLKFRSPNGAGQRQWRATAEGIKWNAPSFRTVEYFATVKLREKKGIGVILHLGARARDLGPDGIVIDDPATLLEWLASGSSTCRRRPASREKP
jgi:hypothetical protein